MTYESFFQPPLKKQQKTKTQTKTNKTTRQQIKGFISPFKAAEIAV